MSEWEEMKAGDVGTSIFEQQPFNSDKRDVKVKTIKAALWLGDIDLLRTLAKSRLGLVTDELRKEIWPVLLRGTTENKVEPELRPGWADLPHHPEEEQVQQDVDRSFVFYPENLDPEKRLILQQDLRDLIVCVLRRNPTLSYFQGYHDVAQVILLIFGSEQASEILEMLSLLYLRDFMLPDLTATLHHLRFLPSILALEDPFLGELLSAQPEPFFALSPILTLFAHHIRSREDISIIFDFILGSGTASLPLYMLVAMIIDQKQALKDLTPGDHDSQHLLLSNLADNFNGDWFEIVKKANTLQEKFPLHAISTWSSVSNYSVLKTTNERTIFIRSEILNYLDHQVGQVKEDRQKKLKEREKELEQREREKRERQERAKKQPQTAVTVRSVLQRDLTRLTRHNLIFPRSLITLTLGVGILAFVGSSFFKYDARVMWQHVQESLRDRN